jgi:hypothetical protein
VIEVDMVLLKIHLMSLKTIYIKIRVEFIIKHIVLDRLEERKVRILLNKSILTLFNRLKVYRR